MVIDGREHTLGSYVREHRNARGFSVRRLAELTDLSQDTIRRIEADKTGVSKSTTLSLEAALTADRRALTELSNERARERRRVVRSVHEDTPDAPPVVHAGGRRTTALDEVVAALSGLARLRKVGLALPEVEDHLNNAVQKLRTT